MAIPAISEYDSYYSYFGVNNMTSGYTVGNSYEEYYARVRRIMTLDGLAALAEKYSTSINQMKSEPIADQERIAKFEKKLNLINGTLARANKSKGK